MQNKKVKKQNARRPSTQRYLPIAEIKDDVVVLKDGTLRMVLITSSINFALKSEDEQNALIGSYVSFLNSLDFPLQIVMQSRKLQIKPYIDMLDGLRKTQHSELMRTLIADYGTFIEELVVLQNIMTKRFFVVVPYDPLSNKKKSYWARVKEVMKPALTIRLKDERFQQRKQDLEFRVRHVMGGLQGMGLEVSPLSTQALIELYYSSYNPDIAFAETLASLDELQVEPIS